LGGTKKCLDEDLRLPIIKKKCPDTATDGRTLDRSTGENESKNARKPQLNGLKKRPNLKKTRESSKTDAERKMRRVSKGRGEKHH